MTRFRDCDGRPGALCSIENRKERAILTTRKRKGQSLVAAASRVWTDAGPSAEASRDGHPSAPAIPVPPSASSDRCRFARLKSLAPRAAIWAGKFRAADLETVRIVSRTARSSGGRRCAVGISKLGNGWLYLFLAAAIFACWGLSGYRIILLATTKPSWCILSIPLSKGAIAACGRSRSTRSCRPCSQRSTNIPFRAATP